VVAFLPAINLFDSILFLPAGKNSSIKLPTRGHMGSGQTRQTDKYTHLWAYPLVHLLAGRVIDHHHLDTRSAGGICICPLSIFWQKPAPGPYDGTIRAANGCYRRGFQGIIRIKWIA
jgi:hypothetical protein